MCSNAAPSGNDTGKYEKMKQLSKYFHFSLQLRPSCRVHFLGVLPREFFFNFTFYSVPLNVLHNMIVTRCVGNFNMIVFTVGVYVSRGVSKVTT